MHRLQKLGIWIGVHLLTASLCHPQEYKESLASESGNHAQRAIVYDQEASPDHHITNADTLPGHDHEQEMHQEAAEPSENIVTNAEHNDQVPIDHEQSSPSVLSLPLEEDASATEQTGIDTVNLEEPQGNWLYKRIWWERAQERYEKIRALVDQIWEFRMQFFLQRADVDRSVLDPFYLFAGFGQGELQEILQEILTHLEQTSKMHEQELGGKEHEILTNVEEEKKSIELLHHDIVRISELDHNVDEAIEKLLEQINRVRLYEREAWNDFKDIAQVLDDTKARGLFYKMDGSWRNIKNIHKYIHNEFANHFKDLVTTLTNEVTRVKASMESLKEKGIDYKKQAEFLFEQQHKSMHHAVTEHVASDDEDSVSETPQKSGMMQNVWYVIKTSIQFVWHIVTYPFGWIYQKIFKSSAK